ncbi:uncharacterized protein SETTUDRAFT_32880 [Exserohilum turcica Et28A]|uniref:Uncharacterized protein n=1 Tax=Exserohilum turcicum (strain 28A) TaxID=671987 RepID=R0K2L5_EXST2|nr:uncharacterized protein SETTUDRAFT_32880 [Exserohilum turcica Et28A]EOA83864.1 hypothetical protein SETTUDRAFT_32880 [Exserohilum turcica Et28A]
MLGDQSSSRRTPSATHKMIVPRNIFSSHIKLSERIFDRSANLTVFSTFPHTSHTPEHSHSRSITFACNSATMDYSDQIQSRLFQIPREIRDMIYFFYFYEPNGLHHHLKGENGVLRTSDGKPLDIRFTRACKAVAKESQGLALKLNTITFTPDDRTGARPLGSDALRFKRLLNALDATKWQLLYNNADYLNPTQIQKLIEMYPRAGRDIVMTLHELKEAQGGHRDDWWARHEWYLREQKHVPDIQKALDMTLEFARTHQYFRMEDYGRGRPFIPHEDPIWSKQKWFRPDLPHAILQWRPNASMIPTESELCALKAYLNPTETCCFDSGNDVTAFAWFFSAASLAASFLESLQPTQRSFLRTIILDENEKAVYNPERHAEELIKFCQENAQMRVERRVGLWDHIFPSRWGADLRGDWWNCTYFFAIDLFVPIVEWITEAENLSALGMPSNSYTLTEEDARFSGSVQSSVPATEGVHGTGSPT